MEVSMMSRNNKRRKESLMVEVDDVETDLENFNVRQATALLLV